jgi:hypothetical protein
MVHEMSETAVTWERLVKAGIIEPGPVGQITDEMMAKLEEYDEERYTWINDETEIPELSKDFASNVKKH